MPEKLKLFAEFNKIALTKTGFTELAFGSKVLV